MTCLDSNTICRLIEVGTCAEARKEACPCSSDKRSHEDFCEDLVGIEGCLSACLDFMEDCCSLEEGDIRLVDTTNYTSYFTQFIRGTPQIYIQSQWGVICDDSFSSVDAEVACGQLGYSAAGT